MHIHTDPTQKNKTQTVASGESLQQSAVPSADHRPEAIAQRKLADAMNNSPRVQQLKAVQQMADSFTNRQQQPIQKKENTTGLPDVLKSGIESLSGYSLDDVKVHYNSGKPAQLQAHAYAQGTEIHVAPGQEKHLPHESWHVVQQKQGRVKPTMQLKSAVHINNDAGLEKEADVMGNKAVQLVSAEAATSFVNTVAAPTKQAAIIQRLEAPLTPEDVGKNYRVHVGGQVLTGRFDSLGFAGMHNFTQVGGENDGAQFSEPYANIIGEAPDVMHEEMDRPVSPMDEGIIEEEEEGIDMERIQDFLVTYEEDSRGMSLKTRKTDQRFELSTENSDVLKDQLGNRKKKKGVKKFIDPSYHETVQYIDVEYGRFYDAAIHELNEQEIPVAYDMLLSQQHASDTGTHFNAEGPSPLTTMTPMLMSTYQDMHYKTDLQVEDETASTRSYESDYTKKMTTDLPFSQWRPFLLPTASTAEEGTMVNSIGASLDVQIPTSGNTIGQGKIYSAIFKHFQRSMELLNQHLDEETVKYAELGPNAFKKRTKDHMKLLDGAFLSGLYKNEEERFGPESGFESWEDLSKSIDTLVILISASLDNVPDNMDEAFEVLVQLNDLKGNNAAYVKQFELIGTIIGLMIKKEKRQVLNFQMFGKEKQVYEALNNLYQLSRVEAEINKQIPLAKINIGKASRKNQESKAVSKELRDLN